MKKTKRYFKVIYANKIPEGISKEEWATIGTRERRLYKRKLKRLTDKAFRDKEIRKGKARYYKSKKSCPFPRCRTKMVNTSKYCKKHMWTGRRKADKKRIK